MARHQGYPLFFFASALTALTFPPPEIEQIFRWHHLKEKRDPFAKPAKYKPRRRKYLAYRP